MVGNKQGYDLGLPSQRAVDYYGPFLNEHSSWETWLQYCLLQAEYEITFSGKWNYIKKYTI